MRDFRLFITDSRYQVPSLYMIQSADSDAARAAAQGVLEDSEHHTAVEVWENDDLLFTLAVGAKPLAAGNTPSKEAVSCHEPPCVQH